MAKTHAGTDATTDQERTDNALAVAQRYATAWLGDDLDGIFGCYADTMSLHYFGNNPFTGDHVGRDAAVATLLATGALAPRRLVSVDDILAGPGTAVLVTSEELTEGDTIHRIRRVLRFAISGDQLTDCWLYEEDQALVDRLWSQ